MALPKYPTSKKTARIYAEELSKLHGKKWIPIKRVKPIKNKYALNFAAIEPDEVLTYTESNKWKVIK